MLVSKLCVKWDALPSIVRCVALSLMGVCAMTALAPLFWTILLIPAFCLLFWSVDHSCSYRGAFIAAWCFGFGFFLSGTYWIANSLLMDSARFGWMIPFATLGLSSILAGYYGLVGVSYRGLIRRVPISSVTARVISFAILFALWEFVRSYAFTGFPWNAIGYSISADDALLQLASVVGIHGMNLLVVLFATLPVVLLYQVKHACYVLGVWVVLLCGLWGWGYTQLFEPYDMARAVTVRIVQGNIQKQRAGDAAYEEYAISEYFRLTREPSEKPIDLVIWPETAFPPMLSEESEWLPKLAALLESKTSLLSGVLRTEGETKEEFRVWNSLAAVTPERKAQYYDKQHLVPFGEYVPFRDILPIQRIIPGKFDFSRGSERELMKLSDGLTIGPLICYEAIFSRYALWDQKPDLLVNITNDGWFGESAAPYQHLHMARMRAVEQGVPMIRAANSGVSAVYDFKGRLIDSIGLNVQAFEEITIPLPAEKEKTIYGRYGLGTFFGLIAMMLGLVILLRRRRGL